MEHVEGEKVNSTLSSRKPIINSSDRHQLSHWS